MKNNIYVLLGIVSAFAIAMGFLESAVVVYLRELYFPTGFEFPISPIEKTVAITELLRELATLIMLVVIGFLAGRNFISRFAWFLFSFAVWDIFYYVFLKLLLDWPESFLTYDVLFLIPVIWIGPVITPIVVALLMILLSYLLITTDNKVKDAFISITEWLLYISGSLILIFAFAWDYGKYVIQNYSFVKIWVWPNNGVLEDISSKYIPSGFNWLLYGIGLAIISFGMFSFYKRYSQKQNKHENS